MYRPQKNRASVRRIDTIDTQKQFSQEQTLIESIKVATSLAFFVNPGGGYGKHRDMIITIIINYTI